MSGSVVVSAPGKVILHGEHAVVYGKAALVSSVGLRCFLTLVRTTDQKVTVNLPDLIPDVAMKKEWRVEDLMQASDKRRQPNCTESTKHQILKELSDLEEEDAPSIIQLAVHIFLYLLIDIYDEKLKDVTGLSATILSNLPAGAGLGSSAAYSVCLAAGFLTICGRIPAASETVDRNDDISKEMRDRIMKAGVEITGRCASSGDSWNLDDLEMINGWGFEAEKLCHGTPSGIDNTISTYGGTISYQSTNVVPLKKIPKIRILIINTGVSRSTKKMVVRVKEQYDKFPLVVESILESISAVSKNAQNLLEQLSEQNSDDSSDLEDLFQLNHHLLNALGVGHPAISEVCRLASSMDLSAKLTGAGGGGCVIALIPQDKTIERIVELQDTLRSAGYESWETTIGSPGVQIHQVDAVLT